MTACDKDDEILELAPVESTIITVEEYTTNKKDESSIEEYTVNDVSKILDKSDVFILSSTNYELSMNTITTFYGNTLVIDYNSTNYCSNSFRGTKNHIVITSDTIASLFNSSEIIDNNQIIIDDIYDYDTDISVSKISTLDFYDGYYDYLGKLNSYSPYAIIKLLNNELSYSGIITESPSGFLIKSEDISLWKGIATIELSLQDDYTPVGYTINYLSDEVDSVITINYTGIDNSDVEPCNGITMAYDTDAINESDYLSIYEHAYFLMIGDFVNKTFTTPNTNSQNLDQVLSIDGIEVDVLNNPYNSFDLLSLGDLVCEDFNHYYTNDYVLSLNSIDGCSFDLTVDLKSALMNNEDYPEIIFDYVSIIGLSKEEFTGSLFYIPINESDIITHTTYNSNGSELVFSFFFDDTVGCYKISVVCTDMLGNSGSEETGTQIIDDGIIDPTEVIG